MGPPDHHHHQQHQQHQQQQELIDQLLDHSSLSTLSWISDTASPQTPQPPPRWHAPLPPLPPQPPKPGHSSVYSSLPVDSEDDPATLVSLSTLLWSDDDPVTNRLRLLPSSPAPSSPLRPVRPVQQADLPTGPAMSVTLWPQPGLATSSPLLRPLNLAQSSLGSDLSIADDDEHDIPVLGVDVDDALDELDEPTPTDAATTDDNEHRFAVPRAPTHPQLPSTRRLLLTDAVVPDSSDDSGDSDTEPHGICSDDDDEEEEQEEEQKEEEDLVPTPSASADDPSGLETTTRRRVPRWRPLPPSVPPALYTYHRMHGLLPSTSATALRRRHRREALSDDSTSSSDEDNQDDGGESSTDDESQQTVPSLEREFDVGLAASALVSLHKGVSRQPEPLVRHKAHAHTSTKKMQPRNPFEIEPPILATRHEVPLAGTTHVVFKITPTAQQAAPPAVSMTPTSTAVADDVDGPIVIPDTVPVARQRAHILQTASSANHNLQLFLTPGNVQVLCAVLRHQGQGGRHPDPSKHDYFYFQARLKHVYPQKHLWSGWEARAGMPARVLSLIAAQWPSLRGYFGGASAPVPVNAIVMAPDSPQTAKRRRIDRT